MGGRLRGERVIAVFAPPETDLPHSVHKAVYLLICLMTPVHTNEDLYGSGFIQSNYKQYLSTVC